MSWSTDDVVRMPVSPSPTRVPTSWPARSERVTPTPTSSNTGCSRISAITIDPTTPVPQTTTRFLMSSPVERRADPVLGEAVVLERVGVRGLGLALLGLAVDLLDRRLRRGRPVEPEPVVDPPGHAERVGDQVREVDVDELVLVVGGSRVVERVERPRPEVQLGVADDAADVGLAVPGRGLRRQRAGR